MRVCVSAALPSVHRRRRKDLSYAVAEESQSVTTKRKKMLGSRPKFIHDKRLWPLGVRAFRSLRTHHHTFQQGLSIGTVAEPRPNGPPNRNEKWTRNCSWWTIDIGRFRNHTYIYVAAHRWPRFPNRIDRKAHEMIRATSSPKLVRIEPEERKKCDCG